jgi:hypothetical protein
MTKSQPWEKVPKYLRRKKVGRKEPPQVLAPVQDDTPVALPEGITYQQVYYIYGVLPRNLRGQWPAYLVRNPPNSGFSFAFVLGKPGAKRVTIFCPFTLESSTVKADAGELLESKPEDMTKRRLAHLVELVQSRWAKYQALGHQRDYAVATAVLKLLGAAVPAQLIKGGEEDKRERGGKPVGDELKKPVVRKGKRGNFLAWFLEDDTRTVREAMVEFDMTRSNVLSYLYTLNKDHGIGYSLVGDTAEVVLPPGCENPFDDQEDDDSYLD